MGELTFTVDPEAIVKAARTLPPNWAIEFARAAQAEVGVAYHVMSTVANMLASGVGKSVTWPHEACLTVGFAWGVYYQMLVQQRNGPACSVCGAPTPFNEMHVEHAGHLVSLNTAGFHCLSCAAAAEIGRASDAGE